MRRASLLILVLSFPVFAGEKAKPAPKWATCWSDAIEEGCALNLPIVVHRHGFY